MKLTKTRTNKNPAIELHRGFRHLKMRNRELEEVRVGLKIGVENGDELVVLNVIAAHSGLEIPGFIAGPHQPVPVNDIDTSLAPLSHLGSDQPLYALVVGVIQNLNQQPLPRPLQLANRRNRLLVHLKTKFKHAQS